MINFTADWNADFLCHKIKIVCNMKSNKFATKKLSDLIRINSKIIQTLALFGRYAYFDPWTICDGFFTGYHN